MRYAHRVSDVRSAEAALMATLPEGALMQRAAAGLAARCADLLGAVYGARVLVLAGSGDNAGDALYAGARLAGRGARVEAVLVGPRTHDAGLTALRRAGGRTVEDAAGADLVLDGIVGIGGHGGLRPDAAQTVDAVMAGVDAPVVAVDVASGVDVDTGRVEGPHVTADVTVTFGTHKVAHFVDPAASSAGVVELVDIGLGPHLGPPAVEVLQPGDVCRLLRRPPADAHKYSRGVLGVVAGSPQYTGAGVLAVSGAAATAMAGMIRYEGASESIIRSAHPEVVIGPGRVQAWVVGSGIGRGLGSQVSSVLADGLPTVVDADGLRYLPSRTTTPVVATPHAGELAQLLDVPRAQVEERMVESAEEAARRLDAVVLLKGRRTVIAAPDGRLRVNTAGTPWLATAGAGDVLSGVVGSLLAAGLDCFDAASAGAWLHGSAAALASSGGPISANDVVQALPETLRAVVETPLPH